MTGHAATTEHARAEMPLGVRAALAGLTLVGLGATVAHAWLRSAEAAGLAPGASWRHVVPLALFVGAFGASFAVGLAALPRPISARERRRVLGSTGIWIWMVGVFVPDRLPLAKVAPLSVACMVWALWAWLGPRVKPRSRAATRWFQLLAGALVLLAAAPWLAWAWMFAS